MTELERQLSESLVNLSKQYASDMKRLEARNAQLSKQVSEFAHCWKTDGDARDHFVLEWIKHLSAQINSLNKQVDTCLKRLEEISNL